MILEYGTKEKCLRYALGAASDESRTLAHQRAQMIECNSLRYPAIGSENEKRLPLPNML